MKQHPPLKLQCPSTAQALRLKGSEWTAEDVAYPIVGGIPWLFPDPKQTLAEWRGRGSLSLDTLANHVEDLKFSIKNAPSKLTKDRLEALRTLKIRHLEMLRRVLEPLKPYTKVSLPKQKACGYRLPLRQGLQGYVPNLIRDWSGEYESENQVLLASTLEILKATKPVLDGADLRILVLGSGSSRLAYDFAKLYPKAQVVAFDLNPLLLLAAKQICDGEKLRASELSVSPKDSANPGRAVELARPSTGQAHNLDFVFGDVYALPFPDSHFDICISPWLIDILPRKLGELCASVARVVKPRGVWVNSGSWHFSFADESENPSLAEAAERATEFGWVSRSSGQIEIPYLQSAFDSHRRFETVTQFVWERDAKPIGLRPNIDDRIDWIRNPSLAIPGAAHFSAEAEKHAVMALVLSLVDDQRSLSDIAAVLSNEHGLSHEQALDAAETFFDRFLKDRTFREQGI